jgi:hypothetical protein
MTSSQTMDHERRTIPRTPGGRTIVVQDNLVAVIESNGVLPRMFVHSTMRQEQARQRLQVTGGKK